MQSLFLLNVVYAQNEECTPQSLRLWIHQDFTNSFGQFAKDIPQFLISTLDQIREEVKDFDIGVSIFRDRETEGFGCWEMVTDFLGADRYDEACSAIRKLSDQKPRGNYNTPEDSLSAIPVLANKHLNDLVEADLNILIIITDASGKLAPEEFPDSGDKEQPEAEWRNDVVCDSAYKYLTVEQAFGDLKKLPVVPYTLLIAPGSRADLETERTWWTDTYSKAGYECDEGQCGLRNAEGHDSASIVAGIVKTLRKAYCVVPTALPTTTAPTTIPTTAPTTIPTTAPTTIPTTVPTTISTTIPTTIPTTAPTAGPTTGPTTVAPAAPTHTSSPPGPVPPEPKGRPAFVLPLAIGLSSAAVLLIGLSAIKFLGMAPAPDLESIGLETTALPAAPQEVRETVVSLEESQFA